MIDFHRDSIITNEADCIAYLAAIYLPYTCSRLQKLIYQLKSYILAFRTMEGGN